MSRKREIAAVFGGVPKRSLGGKARLMETDEVAKFKAKLKRGAANLNEKQLACLRIICRFYLMQYYLTLPS